MTSPTPLSATRELFHAPGKGGGPSDSAHAARLRRGIIDTQVSRPVAVALTGLFLLLIYGIPVSQAVLEKLDGDESSLLDIFERAPTKEHLRAFEREIEQASYAKDYVQPRVQLWLTRLGRAGNKRAVVGTGGWLYYLPGLMHLAGPSFLDPDALARRARDAAEGEEHNALTPDPRPAIDAFARALAARGIALILFPVPDKTMLQPYQLHGRVDPSKPIAVAQSLGWPAFKAQMRARGVAVFDATPARLLPGKPAHFMRQDTHWTPQWMDAVAHDLARTVVRVGGLKPRRGPHTYHTVAQRAVRMGDLVDMLKLPEGQTLFAPQTEAIAQVRDETGAPWQPDAKADVLLLGDSFTNVFSADYMGWGEAAGLGPHLSLALGRPLDVIARNDSGAFATRQLLARALDAGDDRLAGKRVVIWEFASRELSVGDWKPIDWPAPKLAAARAH